MRGNKNNSTNNIDKLLKKNLERIKKKYTALKEKYKTATYRIKNLKNDILKKNDDCIYPNNNDKKYKKINEIYTPEKYINSYIKTSTSLYIQYEDYINNKISKDRKFNYNEKNSFINNLNNMNNVSDFLIIIKALSDITYKNPYNLLRRTLIKINGCESFLINDKKVTESKTYKDIIFSDKNDKYNYIESLYDSNDQELIFVSNLIFIIEFNITDISNIKIKNFKDDFSKIIIKRNLKIMKRKIGEPLSSIFKTYIKHNSYYCPIIFYILQ